MAVITLKTLVLRGVAVTGDVVTARTRIAGYQANGGLPALRSFMRHLSPGCLGTEPERRHDRVDNRDAEHASVRAGRPGSWTGVPVRRSPALSGGRINPLGWSLAEGEPRPLAARLLGLAQAQAVAAVDKVLPGRPNLPQLSTPSTGKRLRLPRTQRMERRVQASRIGFRPAGGTPSASTRGKGA